MKIEVYYWKSDKGADYLHEKTPTIGEFHSDFIKMPYKYNWNTNEMKEDRQEVLKSRICESLFDILNREENPLGTPENQAFIREHKLHTSMSVGDIISFDGKEFWIIIGIGFEKLWN